MHDLAASLRLLAEAVRQTADALEQLNTALAEANRRRYRESGQPFGASDAGLAIWQAFGQATTAN